MTYFCEDITEQIEETIQQPVEEWIEAEEEHCEQQDCNWLLLCANKLVCWIVVTLVKVITWVTVTTTTTITKTVCEIVSVPIAYVSFEMQPILCAIGLTSGDESGFDAADALTFAKISREAYRDPPDVDWESLAEDGGPAVDQLDYFFVSPLTAGYPADTHAYLLEEPASDRLIVAFRGTEGLTDWVDWLNNISAIPIPYGTMAGFVHGGFLTAYLAVRSELAEAISERLLRDRGPNGPIREICFTGHSLGGAMATLAALDYRFDLPDEIEITNYTYGSPKVLNLYVAFDYNARIPNSFRVVNQGDPVPEFPLPGGPTKYRHVKHLVHFTPDGGMAVEPCPRPVTDWANELSKFAPPGVDVAVSGLDAIITFGGALLDGIAQHDIELYVSNLEAVVRESEE